MLASNNVPGEVVRACATHARIHTTSIASSVDVPATTVSPVSRSHRWRRTANRTRYRPKARTALWSRPVRACSAPVDLDARPGARHAGEAGERQEERIHRL